MHLLRTFPISPGKTRPLFLFRCSKAFPGTLSVLFHVHTEYDGGIFWLAHLQIGEGDEPSLFHRTSAILPLEQYRSCLRAPCHRAWPQTFTGPALSYESRENCIVYRDKLISANKHDNREAAPEEEQAKTTGRYTRGTISTAERSSNFV